VFPCREAGAQTYVLHHGNLHSHTAYSDGDKFGAGGPTAQTPATAAAAAKAALLAGGVIGVFGTNDHGEAISATEWTNTKTMLTNSTVPGQFVGLWGFEWTGTAEGANTGFGHLSVIGSDLRSGHDGSADLPDAESGFYIWEHYQNKTSGPVVRTDSLYSWLLANPVCPIDGGTIVVQFNHPSLYFKASLANPGPNYYETEAGVLVGDWWDKLRYVPEVDAYVTLMEMGGRYLLNPPYHNGAANEPYFQLALDNGWHVSPTNNEDNHTDKYCSARIAATGQWAALNGIMTYSGIWAESNAADTKAVAQSKIMQALRARRTFSVEDKASLFSDMLRLKFVANTTSGVKWMGSRGLTAGDVAGSRLRLELTRNAGLILSSVQLITNGGAVARDLPLSGPGVTLSADGKSATWDFGVAASPAPLIVRAVTETQPTDMVYNSRPLPEATGAAPLATVLDARTAGKTERWYYVRVQQNDGTWAFSAPLWLAATPRVPVSWQWDFRDGSAPVTETTGLVKHTYAANGVYHPRVTVTYADGSIETAVCRVSVGQTPPAVRYGDANGDGVINVEDVRLVYRLAAGLEAPGAVFAACDVAPPPSTPGRQARVDIADATRISRFLKGLEPNWPG
jgi:hypothetical protein